MILAPMVLLIAMPGGVPVASTPPYDAGRNRPKYEGDWYVSDTTDNNTGEREVYAFQTYFGENGADFVKVTLRCYQRKPVMFVEWDGQAFPDQTVMTIGVATGSDDEPKTERVVFERSDDVVDRGLRATPDASSAIVAKIGAAKYMTLTAHLTPAAKTIGFGVAGMPGAWSRVSRHCPAPILPRPPM